MVRTTIQDEIKDEYTRTMATTDLVISEYLRQQKPEKEEEESWKDSPCMACTTYRRSDWYWNILPKKGQARQRLYQIRQDPGCRLCKDAPAHNSRVQDATWQGIHGTP